MENASKFHELLMVVGRERVGHRWKENRKRYRRSGCAWRFHLFLLCPTHTRSLDQPPTAHGKDTSLMKDPLSGIHISVSKICFWSSRSFFNSCINFALTTWWLKRSAKNTRIRRNGEELQMNIFSQPSFRVCFLCPIECCVCFLCSLSLFELYLESGKGGHKRKMKTGCSGPSFSVPHSSTFLTLLKNEEKTKFRK